MEIEKGSILTYRVFDIAEEINLKWIEKILRQDEGKSRVKLARSTRRALIMRDAPVRMNLGTVSLQFETEKLLCEAQATVWDYGAVSIAFQIPISSGTRMSELVQKSPLFNGDMKGSEIIDEVATRKAKELKDLFSAALRKPQFWETFEDYTVYFFEKIKGVQKGQDLLNCPEIPPLILGEPSEVLSEKTRNGIIEHHYQYAEDDLAIIDWNSAVVFEPNGQKDVPDVLEFALAHMLELRFYDDLLDTRLDLLYDEIEKRRQRILSGSYAKAAREANTRYVEFLEFTERVENSLKVVGDFYLAVIFRAAIRRFRVLDWQTSVSRKMNALARISELLLGETNVYRSHFLELTIILLIAFEIVSTLLRIM